MMRTNGKIALLRTIAISATIMLLFLINVCPAAANKNIEKQIEIDYEALGKKLYWSGQYPEALEAYQKALKLRPKNPENHYMTGLSLLKSGKARSAISYFESAIDLYRELNIKHNKGILNSYLNQARAYNELQNYKEVEKISRLVMALFPRNTSIYNILGNSHMARKDYDRAVEIFNNALKINPPNGYTFNNLGMVYLEQGNVEAANIYFQRAVKLVPFGAAFIYNNLALTYEMIDNNAAAIENYRKALSIDPENANAHEALNRLTGR
jgi:tetratricopeptide (TPR) repeat protein